MIYSFGAALFYANASLFAREIRELLATSLSPVRWLIVDAESHNELGFHSGPNGTRASPGISRSRSCVGLRSCAYLYERIWTGTC